MLPLDFQAINNAIEVVTKRKITFVSKTRDAAALVRNVVIERIQHVLKGTLSRTDLDMTKMAIKLNEI